MMRQRHTEKDLKKRPDTAQICRQNMTYIKAVPGAVTDEGG